MGSCNDPEICKIIKQFCRHYPALTAEDTADTSSADHHHSLKSVKNKISTVWIIIVGTVYNAGARRWGGGGQVQAG